MLTNNKKSIFAKSIAMIMAVLMVLAVCLTGCADKEAQAAANTAQTTATEAKTLAEEVKASLADYLKSADAVTVEKVNAAIDAALAGYAKTADLADFVKSGELTALSNKLSEYIKGAEVDGKITTALAAYVKSADLATVEANLKASYEAADKAAKDAIMNTLNGYVKAENLAAAKTELQELFATADGALKTEVMNALAGYIDPNELAAAKTELNNALAAADAALKAEIEATLAGYVEADELAAVVADLEAAVGSIADLEVQLEAVEAEIAELSASISTEITNALVAYATKVEVEALAGKLDAKDEELAADIADVADALAALAEAVEATDADLAVAIDELVAGLTAANADIADVVADLADLAETVAADNAVLADDLADLADRLADLEKVSDDSVIGLNNRLEKLEGVVEAILKAFFTEEEIKARAEEIDLLDMSAAEITAHIQAVWSEAEWTATTAEVLALIVEVQTLLDVVYDPVDGIYTAANKALINKALKDAGLNVTIFDANGKLVDKDANVEMLTYSLLRVPNRKVLAAYEAGIDAANKVPTFEVEYEALLNNYLYNIGHIETVGTGTAAKNYQVITVVEEDDLKAFNVAYDELLTKYARENAFAGYTNYAAFATLKAINVFKNGTALKAVDANEYKTTDAAGKEVVWTKVGQTIRTAGDYVADAKLPSSAALDWASVTTDKVAIAKYGTTPIEVVEYKSSEAGTYAALYEQLDTCKALIKTANDTFAAFLTETIQKNTAATLSTDDDYYNALTSDMCVPVQGYPTYSYYLAGNVQEAIEAAVARLSCGDEAHEAEALKAITKLDLYNRMMEKVWNELFALYQSYAATMVNTMLADYISITYQVTAADFADVAVDATTIAGSATYSAEMALTVGKYTDGFVEAFLNGTGAFTGWKSYTVGSYAALDITKSFKDTALVNYYGALNGTAMTSATEAIIADPAATIADNAVALRQYLTASVVNVRTAIENAKAADYNDGVAKPQDAFVALLKEAVANLDEVYNRYLVEDYKAVLVNEIYNKADDLAVLYSGYADTVLIEAMEQYLTGYSVTTGEAVAADVTANKLFPTVAVLTNGAMVADMAANYTVDVNDKSVMSINGIDKVANLGGKAMADAAASAEAFLVNLEEMAIKDNFMAYLDTALDNLQFAYFDYLTIKGLSYETQMKLNVARNNADSTITITKFQEQMDLIEFGTYKTNYKALLTIIATADQDTHAEALGLAKFAERLKAVVSSQHTTDSADGAKKVYYPVDSKSGSTTEAYNYVGTAVVAFDEIVNVNAEYVVVTTVTNNGVTTTVTTYHKLYK